jgi:hypothetical protein
MSGAPPAGEKIHQPQSPHPSQRHLALPAAQKFRHTSVQRARWVDRIFTLIGHRFTLKSLINVDKSTFI